MSQRIFKNLTSSMAEIVPLKPKFCMICTQRDDLVLIGRFWVCGTCQKGMEFDPPPRVS